MKTTIKYKPESTGLDQSRNLGIENLSAIPAKSLIADHFQTYRTEIL